jgi:hypothetical protein
VRRLRSLLFQRAAQGDAHFLKVHFPKCAWKQKYGLSRLTLQSAFRQIALWMNARSPFPANKRSDDSDLA